MDIKLVEIDKPEESNVIIGQSHFIKTVEDVYEAMITSVPGIKFGFAFCEASGKRLIRHCGTDEKLRDFAVKNAEKMGAGHSFILILGNVYPVNILKKLREVDEILNIFAATANPLKVIILEEGEQRGIMGVLDGQVPLGVEGDKDIEERKGLLRKIGYKF